jgi:hypothetical protein
MGPRYCFQHGGAEGGICIHDKAKMSPADPFSSLFALHPENAINLQTRQNCLERAHATGFEGNQ